MQSKIQDDTLLSRAEVQTHFNLSQRFLEVAASRGNGPAFVKIGRSVRYQAGDIRAWINSQKMQSTCTPKQGEARQ
ncbi:MAG: helix-turn-helix transcriptional regulator [Planktomarina sp.]